MSTKKPKPKSNATPKEDIRTVHRVTDAGPHRIEIHSPDAPPEIGEWAESHGIAQLKNYRATRPYYSSSLPAFFKVVEVPYRRVGDYPTRLESVVMGETNKLSASSGLRDK